MDSGMKDITIPEFNSVLRFPQDATDEEIQSTVMQLRENSPNRIAQSVMPMANQIANYLFETDPRNAESVSTLPSISGSSVYGMTPEQTQATLQLVQQDNIANRQMVKQSQEAEKDRSDRLRLMQQKMKNDNMEAQLNREHEKNMAEVSADAQIKIAEMTGVTNVNEARAGLTNAQTKRIEDMTPAELEFMQAKTGLTVAQMERMQLLAPAEFNQIVARTGLLGAQTASTVDANSRANTLLPYQTARYGAETSRIQANTQATIDSNNRANELFPVQRNSLILGNRQTAAQTTATVDANNRNNAMHPVQVSGARADVARTKAQTKQIGAQTGQIKQATEQGAEMFPVLKDGAILDNRNAYLSGQKTRLDMQGGPPTLVPVTIQGADGNLYQVYQQTSPQQVSEDLLGFGPVSYAGLGPEKQARANAAVAKAKAKTDANAKNTLTVPQRIEVYESRANSIEALLNDEFSNVDEDERAELKAMLKFYRSKTDKILSEYEKENNTNAAFTPGQNGNLVYVRPNKKK